MDFGFSKEDEAFRTKVVDWLKSEIPARWLELSPGFGEEDDEIWAIARDFERSSSADYRRLADSEQNPRLRQLFLHLADEEGQHLRSLHGLSKQHPEESFSGLATRATDVPPVARSKNNDTDTVITTAIQHEQATEQFYRALSIRAAVPFLRTALAELANAEASHKRHLEHFRATGSFDEEPA